MMRLKPEDCTTPDWVVPYKYVHDWRAYINDELRAIWQTFTVEQRRTLAENAQTLADAEDWD